MNSEEAEPEPSRDQPKASRGSLWKDRLKDKASKLTKGHKPSRSQTDQEVSDFLRTSSVSSSAKPPRLDTSSPVTHAGAPEDQFVPARGYVPPPKKRRKLPAGIHVGFADTPPDIIGEGGDESVVPTRDVVEAWRASGKTFELSNPDDPSSVGRKNSVTAPDSLQPGYNPNARRSSIQRTPTRHVTPDGWQQKRLSMSMEEGLVQASKDESEVPAPPAHRALPPPVDPPAVQPLAPEQQEPLASKPYLQQTPQVNRKPLYPERESYESSRVDAFENKPYVSAVQQLSRQSTDDDRGSVSDYVPYNPIQQPRLPTLDLGPDVPLDSAPQSNLQPRTDVDSERRPSLTTQNLQSRPAPTNKYDFVDSPESLKHQEPRGPRQSDDRGSRQTQPRTTERFPSPQAPPTRDRRSKQSFPADSATLAAAEVAGEDLYSRLQHLRGMFRLAADKVNQTSEKSLVYWLRASSWWFLRGRTMLEGAMRASRQGTNNSRPGSRSGEPELPQNKQCYVDMAKAFWITEEILPEMVEAEQVRPSRHPDRIDGLTVAQLTDTYSETRREMQLFALSLQKRNLLPPHALMIQGADPLIWIPYPGLPAGIFATTAGLDPRTLAKPLIQGYSGFFPMLVADTSRHFCYGRVFGEVELVGDEDADDDAHFPSMISILRDKEQSNVEFTVSSQDGQINFHVQMDRKLGPTWEDVEWRVKTHSLRIRLSRDIGVVIRLWETDFKTLWGIYDYNRRVEEDRQPKANEEVLYKEYVAAFHYIPTQGAQTAFPTSLVKHCQVRLFQMNIKVNEGSGARNVFAGYRIVAVTPPYIKVVSSISRVLGDGAPILTSKLTGEGGLPALGFAMHEAGKRETIYLTFDHTQSRAVFQNILSGADPSPDECYSEVVPLESMNLAKFANAPKEAGNCEFPASIQWQNLRIINQGASLESAPTLFSNRLRICAVCNLGTVTDRINLGTGDLRVGLDPSNLSYIKLYRPIQKNLIVNFGEHEVKKDSAVHLAIQQSIATTASNPTARIYQFKSLPSLHEFQSLVTGCSVLYDGQASSFSISRRRAMVPIYKRLEATLARIQIISDDSTIQLLAFLKDFVHGRCMSFTLRGTDAYESSSKSGVHYIRLVDAKFAMPKPENDEGWDMVCLDQIEYPSEHDDILVGFNSEDDRDLFAKALPASVSKGSKMTSFIK